MRGALRALILFSLEIEEKGNISQTWGVNEGEGEKLETQARVFELFRLG